jgi:hypothetical protein
MKKMLTILALLTIATSAIADDRRNGPRDDRRDGPRDQREIELNDGKRIIRIDIGNDRDEGRELTQRLLRLERAVRELQNRVYDLEDDARAPRQVKVTTCLLKTPFDGTFTGKGANELEARKNAVAQCIPTVSFVFCNDSNIKVCSETIETIR